MHPKDNAEAANNPANRLVKHGFGIYLYNTKAEKPSKYEVYSLLYRDNGTETINRDKVNSQYPEHTPIKATSKTEPTTNTER